MRPEAPEGEVVVGAARDVEAIGVVEDRLVAIRRRIPHAHILSGLDADAREFEILDRRARKLKNG